MYSKTIESITEMSEKLEKYEKLEKQGLLKIFPCKIGDYLYQPVIDLVSEFIITSILISNSNEILFLTQLIFGEVTTGYQFSEHDIGKSVFLTKNEASKKLKKSKIIDSDEEDSDEDIDSYNSDECKIYNKNLLKEKDRRE